MGFPIKYQIATLTILSAASSAFFAHDHLREICAQQTSVPDARTIVSQSVAATDRSWQARSRYTFVERDQDRRLDMKGKVKSENIDVTRMLLINGVRFEQLMERNGQPPSAEEQKKIDRDRENLSHESEGERAARISKDQENRAFLADILGAFDFQLIGEETCQGRPAYVIQVTPHPGYRAHGKYGKMFSKVEGRLWVDKQDFGWIKVDGQVTESFTMGLFVARVQQGSRIILEQTNVGDRVWVPERLEMRAIAKLFFLKTLAIERVLTYSDYLAPENASYSVSSLK